jgi:hypothetical protein
VGGWSLNYSHLDKRGQEQKVRGEKKTRGQRTSTSRAGRREGRVKSGKRVREAGVAGAGLGPGSPDRRENRRVRAAVSAGGRVKADERAVGAQARLAVLAVGSPRVAARLGLGGGACGAGPRAGPGPAGSPSG